MRKFVPYLIIYTTIFYLPFLGRGRPSFALSKFRTNLNPFEIRISFQTFGLQSTRQTLQRTTGAPRQSNRRVHQGRLEPPPPTHSAAIRSPWRRRLLPFLSPCKHPTHAIVVGHSSSSAIGRFTASRPPPSFPTYSCKHSGPQPHQLPRAASSRLESSFSLSPVPCSATAPFFGECPHRPSFCQSTCGSSFPLFV
jgi:hypothetical protein